MVGKLYSEDLLNRVEKSVADFRARREMKLLLFIDRWLTRVTGWLIIFFLGVMIVMAFGQVVLRNFFHTSIEWGCFSPSLGALARILGAIIALAKAVI